MFGTHDLALFIVAGLLLNFTPGADTLYIVSRASAQGTRAGVAAALGVGAGCCVHMTAAALGLSALLMASATAFVVVKVAGAVYLVYLGLSMLRSQVASPSANPARAPDAPLRTVFAQGVLTNVLNPKVALFFLAFLPQFIAAGAPDKVTPFLFLGIVFNVNATAWNLFVAWSSARLSKQLQRRGGGALWLRRVAGAAFVGLGIRLALSERGG